MKTIGLVIAIVLIHMIITNAEAGQVFTWTDADGNLHITDTPPPQQAKIKDVIQYKKKTPEEIQAERQQEEDRAGQQLKENKQKEIEAAKRNAREADKRAKEATARATKITKDAEAYVRRLGSTKEKRKQFKNRIQEIKAQAETAQNIAKAANDQARRAAEEVNRLEEEAAASLQEQTQE